MQHANLKSIAALSSPLPIEVPNGAIVATIPTEEERPIPVTELIFAPRKKEMNKGFLMFSQDEGLTMLKDEPEDLTHLAPTAGDACIPLENSPFDMFDEFILSDNYCSLLGDDLANGSPVDSLTTDSLLLSSPEPHETDSSCEQSSLLTELSLDAFDGIKSDNDTKDGSSPFIPAGDELPVLEPAVMWGALPDNVSLARPQPSEQQLSTPAPALQSLLVATPTGPPPQDLITNIYTDQGLILNSEVSTWKTGVKRVMVQDEEPNAKRLKRSQSPSKKNVPSTQSSSVLMNLLDTQQMKTSNCFPDSMFNSPKKMQMPMGSPNYNDIPVPVINIIQAMPKQVIRAPPMSPLSLNIDNSMYSSPSPSYYSPKDRVLSPYTPQSLSPVGKFSQTYQMDKQALIADPYLSNRMRASPIFPLQPSDLLLDTNMLMASDFWNESEMLQETCDLLTAFDEVRLM